MSLNQKHFDLLKRKDQSKALEDCLKDTGSMQGKRVLEIGSDWDGVMLRIMKEEFGALECTGLNPEIDHAVIENGFRLLPKNGADTGLPDQSIDLVFSHATLEHVIDLEKLLIEIYRVLKISGKAWLSFGPIWSSSKGHHLWVKDDGEKYTFTENNPIPDYAHLLWSEEKLLDYLIDKQFKRELSEKICSAVYHESVINRLFYEDYIKLFQDSKLAVRRVKKERDTSWNIFKRTIRYLPTSLQLMYKYPFQDLSTYGATVVLEKRS